ncbi:MAG: hypothetical protein ABI813_14030 [Bacteroidota bacterium]
MSTIFFICAGKPRQLLVAAGAINEWMLPEALSIELIIASKPALMKCYRHPRWLQTAGWIVVLTMRWMG